MTGAGRGIGQAIALGDAGLTVALRARSEEELAETARQIAGCQGHCLELPADFCNRGQVEGMV